MKFPRPLMPGEKVAIISPAGKIDRRVVEHGAQLLEQHGFTVEIGRHACDAQGVFAGADRARAADMQQALDDPSVRAVFFSRGGYGSLRTHLRLDWSAFLRDPKWLVGFSDVTVFHAYLARRGIASVHGVMSSWFARDGMPTTGFLELLELLAGKLPGHVLPPHALNRIGTAAGTLTGGNLSIIQSLRGTPLDIRPKGRILFIEDLGEHHYHLDRMMQNLKAGGVLEPLAGLVAGSFTGMKDGATPYGQTAYEIIREAVEPYHYPVAFDFPAGHALPNLPLLMGGRYSLEVSAGGVLIKSHKRRIDG
jgi:muramoyltetrapeptide carboxypeptidase